MTKMFCDRCGAEIQKYSQCGWLTRRVVYSELRLSCSGSTYEDIDANLCPKCEEEFNIWFKEKSK